MKQDKTKLIELLKSGSMAKAILEELNAVQELPKQGLIAGQAVSSIVTEILNLNFNSVINDIDIFYTYSDNFAIDAIVNKFRNSELDNELSSSDKIIVSTDTYSHVTSMNSHRVYSILGTTRYKKLNKVWVRFNNVFYKYETRNMQRELISNFDINSTQIGIDIETKEVIFSENFIQYLITRQLDIVYWNTPVHSLIRLLKKQKELGVFCNTEQNKMLVSTIQTAYKESLLSCLKEKNNVGDNEFTHVNYSAKEFLYQMKNVSLFFGSKMKDNYDLFQDQLSEFVLLNRVSEGREVNLKQIAWLSEIKTDSLWTLNEKSDNYIESFLASFSREDILSLDRNFDFKKTYENMFKGEIVGVNNTSPNSAIAYIKAIPQIYKAMTKTRKNIMHFIDKTLFKSFFSLKIAGLEDFHKIPEKDWILLKRIYKKHPDLIINLSERLSALEIMRVINIVYKLEKEYGEIIYGALESRYIPGEFIYEDSLTEYIKYIHKIKNEQLKERLVDYVGEYGVARELISGLELEKEGSEMNHCVSGYSRKVLHGKSIIISCKNSENKRFTIELSPIDKKKLKYKIIQVQKRFNKRTELSECKDLLKIINNSYKVFPLTAVSKNAFRRRVNNIFNEENELPF